MWKISLVSNQHQQIQIDGLALEVFLKDTHRNCSNITPIATEYWSAKLPRRQNNVGEPHLPFELIQANNVVDSNLIFSLNYQWHPPTHSTPCMLHLNHQRILTTLLSFWIFVCNQHWSFGIRLAVLCILWNSLALFRPTSLLNHSLTFGFSDLSDLNRTTPNRFWFLVKVHFEAATDWWYLGKETFLRQIPELQELLWSRSCME